MSSAAIYLPFVDRQLVGPAVDFDDDTIKVMLVTSDYTFSAAHEFRSSVVASEASGTNYEAKTLANVVTSTVSTTVSVTSDDVVWASTASSGFTFRYAVIYKDTGNAATDVLVSYHDYGTDKTNLNNVITLSWGANGFVAYNSLSLGIVDTDYVQFDITYVDGTNEGRLQWNIDDGTLEVGMPGGDVNLQIGQEMLIRVRNTSGVEIPNGSVVEAVGASGGKILVALANASNATARVVGVATEAILHNANGYITNSGLVRDVDTDGMTIGNPVFLSGTVDGAFTESPPTPPDHFWAIGLVVTASQANGSIWVGPHPFPPLAYSSDVDISSVADNDVINWDSASGTWKNTGDVTLDSLTATTFNNVLETDLSSMRDILIGAALDTPVVDVTSNGSTITLSMEKSGTGDVRFWFSSGTTTVDCTPTAATITLTEGTDTTPQLNYIYILESTGVLTKSISDWPSAEHAPVATVMCQTAASLATDGAYKVHAWTDHTSSAYTGHLGHLNYWIRTQPATWREGTLATVNAGASTFDLAVSSGTVLQLHNHAFPTFDTATGSEVMVINDSVTPYVRSGDLTGITLDANGASLNNKYFNVVIWGVVSEDSEDCQIMVNLPTGSYTGSASAQTDVSGTAVYTIPVDYAGVGFLIARLTMRLQSGTNYTEELNTSLRGLFPTTGAGGSGGGGGATELIELTDVDTAADTANFVLATPDGTTGLYSGRALVKGDIDGLSLDLAVLTATSYGGITEANLLDKTAAETISAAYTFDDNIFILESASADADVAGDGQIWVKNDTPNIPMFTDDAGTDLPMRTDQVLLAAGTASAVATLEFTDLTSEFIAYEIYFSGAQPATDNQGLVMQMSTDNGSTWKAGATDYTWNYQYVYTASGGGGTNSTWNFDDSDLQITGFMGNAGYWEDGAMHVTIHNPSNATYYTRVLANCGYYDAGGNLLTTHGSGQYQAQTAVDAVRVFFWSGNIDNLTYRLYGVRA